MHGSSVNFTRTKTFSNYRYVYFILTFFLFFSPVFAFAQDTEGIDTLRRLGKAFANIAEKTSPAIVGIKVQKTITQNYRSMDNWPFDDRSFDPFNDDFFDYFFRRRTPQRQSPQRKYLQRAQGSGFIISADGYILTNNHLVGETDEDGITVTLSDGRELTAKTVGTDPESDVALIKIDADNLAFLELADSDALEVGEWVIAIGNPFGLSHTVTAGIVSAKGRSGIGLTAYEDFIQTDAAINPGNSGGPLVNLDGKVVGINSAIIGPGGNIGIGLAIPINMAKGIYSQLIETGTVVRGFLGILPQDLDPKLAESFGLKDSKGILIPEVTPDSAADKAGVKPGDIIIKFNGKTVEKAQELRNRIAMLKPGTEVEIVVLQDGKQKTLTAKLSERPAGGLASGEAKVTELGLTVHDLPVDLSKRFDYTDLTGVIVTNVEPSSLAELAGIKPGNLITEVNRRKINNTKEFNEAVENASEEGAVLLLVKDERGSRFVVLTIPKK